MTSLITFLESKGACEDAREWADGKTWPEAYRDCPRGDWMLWLFQKTMPKDEENLRRLTLAKAECAKTVIHLMKDPRSVNAIEVAIKFGNNEATRSELDAAADAAYAAAAYAAYAADAAYAAYAAYAAAAADAAADAAYAAAAYTANAAAAAAANAAAAAYARQNNRKLTADICRRILPIEIWNVKL